MISECPTAPAAVATVGVLKPADVARWDDFVLRCPAATFFHRAGWQSVIEAAFGHRCWFLYAEVDGQIRGVLPLAQVNSRLFGNSLCSLPFCVYGGIAALDEGAAAALDQAAQQLAARLGVDYLEYRNLGAARHADWIGKELYCTFRKRLHAQTEQNMLDIPRKQRAMVRKGIAAGLHSAIDYDVEHFFAAYSASVHRLGTPVFAKRYFALLREVFGASCEVITVYRKHDTIASVMVFYFRDEVLPYYGGGTEAARSVAGNDFMYWEVMRRACQRNYTLFDFGRSKLGTGAWDFKKNWGFAPQPLHYEYQLLRGRAVPDNNPLNPRYQRFIQLWRRLPLPLANMLGPHIVRYLG
ncbi:FemAB family XrtA/PEP-CTERM system-associated protein [Janthinobacterium fluminis]|uniref:FemAB family PEP-CTERM system-associated protein n=1 Tax=Janthinobacterium fluminis TaxID=2987524 RepID=A0ABT5JXI5_9BURK|nr:FemAB family XrtA/PEP-CTERM system-associated protein [Janthinobacterium fluminis]MDC8756865.1 FemAB family PEP-CTERM system-associated protein [Janthinobacterium fluminis]